MPRPERGDVAGVLARKADEDATAVREFAGNRRIADSVIGFHAQQATEKWLKAVVAARGGEFERTYDGAPFSARKGLAPQKRPKRAPKPSPPDRAVFLDLQPNS